MKLNLCQIDHYFFILLYFFMKPLDSIKFCFRLVAFLVFRLTVRIFALTIILVYILFFLTSTNQPWIEYVFFSLFLLFSIKLPATFQKPAMIRKKEAQIQILKLFTSILLWAFIILAHIKYFFIQPFRVQNHSMVPILHPDDFIVVEKISMGLIINFYEKSNTVRRLHPGFERKPALNDIIVFRRPDIPGTGDILIKRIHAIKNNKYCVMGDNQDHSVDSRVFGCLDEKQIIGRFIYKLSG
ncbi:MAG: S26 family signal peptidase [Spirochaetia bacterium]|nr:S26 family signal peptidase [Spirochaetia bacterium]